MTTATHTHRRAITNTSESPFAKLKSINYGDCQWTKGFWAEKFQLAEQVMVPHMGTLLKGDICHAYNNFEIAAGIQQGEAKGMLWHDGDFYKWMESAIYVYGVNRDALILGGLDAILEVIGKAQAVDGYLHTHVQIKGLERWSQVTNHELYNSGHLLTGACIHHRVTGKTNWLDIAIKRGPVVYCIESTDLPTDSTIPDVYIAGDTDLEVNHRPDFLGGVTTIGLNVLLRSDKGEGMYRTIEQPEWQAYQTEFVPYFTWSNRGTAEMTVFMPVVW